MPIDPKNLTAQFAHRSRGNPESTLPIAAISNCFPGLEFDFRNIWRRILEGIELHEARPEVVRVDSSAPAPIQGLVGRLLISVDGEQLWSPVTGPQVPNGPDQGLGFTNLEWANALAGIVRKGGQSVECVFLNRQSGQTEPPVNLTVRHMLDHSTGEERPALARELAEPGELTQSLCSPWQNDYLECACYYWAASRPDFVNTQETDNDGHNWLHKNRGQNTPRNYSLRNADLVGYEDLFQNWEGELKFIEGGQDKE